MRRKIFSRTDTFMALCPVRISKDETIEIGETIPDGMFKRHALRGMYNRRKIGAVDCPCAKQIVERKLKSMETKVEEIPEEPTQEPVEENDKDERETLWEIADEHGVEYDKRWGVKRLKEALGEVVYE